MADSKKWFDQTLYNEVHHGERIAHHALDNYGMDMSKELVEALQALEKASREVLKEMKS